MTLSRDAVTHRIRLIRWFKPAYRTKETSMAVLALTTPLLVAAAGYSLIYLLLGGGLGGAILIFIVAKMLGR
jgi:hypothetical protein